MQEIPPTGPAYVRVKYRTKVAVEGQPFWKHFFWKMARLTGRKFLQPVCVHLFWKRGISLFPWLAGGLKVVLEAYLLESTKGGWKKHKILEHIFIIAYQDGLASGEIAVNFQQI